MFHSPEISQVCMILDCFRISVFLCDCVRCVHPLASKFTRLSVSKDRNQDKLSDLHHRDWLRNFSPYLWLTMPSEMTYWTDYAPTGTILSCILWFMYSRIYCTWSSMRRCLVEVAYTSQFETRMPTDNFPVRARSDWRKKQAECESCQGESLT